MYIYTFIHQIKCKCLTKFINSAGIYIRGRELHACAQPPLLRINSTHSVEEIGCHVVSVTLMCAFLVKRSSTALCSFHLHIQQLNLDGQLWKIISFWSWTLITIHGPISHHQHRSPFHGYNFPILKQYLSEMRCICLLKNKTSPLPSCLTFLAKHQ